MSRRVEVAWGAWPVADGLQCMARDAMVCGTWPMAHGSYVREGDDVWEGCDRPVLIMMMMMIRGRVMIGL